MPSASEESGIMLERGSFHSCLVLSSGYHSDSVASVGLQNESLKARSAVDYCVISNRQHEAETRQ